MTVKAIEIDPMVDLNLGVEYRYSKVLSGFITLNNILGQRYYHWYNYPSYRFNMMLGITYSF
jgi:outer membrane receptor protein involved in Fe transport